MTMEVASRPTTCRQAGKPAQEAAVLSGKGCIYVAGETTPTNHVLRAGLRDLVGRVALIRRGRLAYSLPGDRAADRCPHRDPPHPGPSVPGRVYDGILAK